MYVAMGALSAQTQQAVSQALPSCYTQTFDFCLKDRNRKDPKCVRYEPVHKAYAEDFSATKKLIDDLPFCQLSPMHAAVGAVALLAVGVYWGKRAKR